VPTNFRNCDNRNLQLGRPIVCLGGDPAWHRCLPKSFAAAAESPYDRLPPDEPADLFRYKTFVVLELSGTAVGAAVAQQATLIDL
jgi:hypothetical protein